MIFYSSGKPDEVPFIFFSSLNFTLMFSVLVLQYYYGSVLCSIWYVGQFVGDSRYVYASSLGYYEADYFESPYNNLPFGPR